MRPHRMHRVLQHLDDVPVRARQHIRLTPRLPLRHQPHPDRRSRPAPVHRHRDFPAASSTDTVAGQVGEPSKGYLGALERTEGYRAAAVPQIGTYLICMERAGNDDGALLIWRAPWWCGRGGGSAS